MEDRRLKILYIAGEGRSGSTLLANILGHINGFFHAGELAVIWEFGLVEDAPCACGVRFRKCPVWCAVFDRAFGGMNQVNPQQLIRERDTGLRTWRIPQLLMPSSHAFVESNLNTYASHMGKLYQAIHEITGSRVIIDSSKAPMHLRVLGEFHELDTYVIHLIRDPRGVAYSARRKRLQPGTNFFHPQYHPARLSARWSIWNLATPPLAKSTSNRYFRLLYEDFIDRPQISVRAVLAFVGESVSDLPFLDDLRVDLRKNHGIWGNPNRFQTGQVELRRDTEWQSRMKLLDRLIVTAITWPLLFRYGYPIMTGRTEMNDKRI